MEVLSFLEGRVRRFEVEKAFLNFFWVEMGNGFFLVNDCPFWVGNFSWVESLFWVKILSVFLVERLFSVERVF
jgi:hypothetical protein